MDSSVEGSVILQASVVPEQESVYSLYCPEFYEIGSARRETADEDPDESPPLAISDCNVSTITRVSSYSVHANHSRRIAAQRVMERREGIREALDHNERLVKLEKAKKASDAATRAVRTQEMQRERLAQRLRKLQSMKDEEAEETRRIAHVVAERRRQNEDLIRQGKENVQRRLNQLKINELSAVIEEAENGLKLIECEIERILELKKKTENLKMKKVFREHHPRPVRSMSPLVRVQRIPSPVEGSPSSVVSSSASSVKSRKIIKIKSEKELIKSYSKNYSKVTVYFSGIMDCTVNES